MSIFGKPLGVGRLGSYMGGGTAVGAGAGAMLAGEDHRTAGAVVGGVVGGTLGAGVGAYHGFGRNLSNGVLKTQAALSMHDVNTVRGGIAGMKATRIASRQAIKDIAGSAMHAPNFDANMHRVSGFVQGIMGRFR